MIITKLELEELVELLESVEDDLCKASTDIANAYHDAQKLHDIINDYLDLIEEEGEDEDIADD